MSAEQNSPKLDPLACRDLVRSMAMIVSNTLNSYWLSRADAHDAMVACHAKMNDLLGGSEALDFAIIDDKVMLNDDFIECDDKVVAAFLKHLAAIEVDNFAIGKGISDEEFTRFIEVLEMRPAAMEAEGGFMGVIQARGIGHVKAQKLVFKKVSEEEVVVKKDEVGKGGGGGPGASEMANVLAFLKGNLSAKDDRVSDDVKTVASDPERMAALIMDAANVQGVEQGVESPETLVDFVVGCLKRTYDGMTSDRSAKTKAGKKRITKNLLLLEEEILNRMREMSVEWDEEDIEAIVGTVEEMTDEIKMDEMMDDYATKQRAIEKSEEQLLEFIKSKGIESVDDVELQKRLSERGVGPEQWRQLVLKAGGEGAGAGAGMGPGEGAGPGLGAGDGAGSGGGPGLGAGPGGGPGFGPGAGPGAGGGAADMVSGLLDAIGHLDTLLGQMEEEFEHTEAGQRQANAGRMLEVFTEVHGQVGALAAQAGQRFETLLSDVQADEELIAKVEAKVQGSGLGLRTTRQDILKALAEIARDIGEPLELISSSLYTLSSKTFGGINESQKKVLDMAQENVGRVQGLLQNMKSITTDS